VGNIKMSLRDRSGWYELEWYGLVKGPEDGPCEHGNEQSVSITCWELLEYLHNWQLHGVSVSDGS
jgi:hypothetical protein